MDLPLINSILRELSSPVSIPHVSIPHVSISHVSISHVLGPHISIPSVKTSYVISFVIVMLFSRNIIALLLRLPEDALDFLDSCFRAFYRGIEFLVGLVTPSYAFRTTGHNSSYSHASGRVHGSWGDTFDYREQHSGQETRSHSSDKSASPHCATSCDAQCYDVLGLSPAATPKEVKSAYRSLIKKTHPDLFVRASPERQRRASVTSVKLREAYEAIVAVHGPQL